MSFLLPGPVLIDIQIQPSKNLTWTPCFTSFRCARLEVPLDWSDPGNNSTAVIAIMKFPSPLDPSDPRHRGPILYNPGGPGGSGTQLLPVIAKTFQELLGEEYDILSFDPRGVGQTTPPLLPFLNLAEKTTFNLLESSDPPFNSTPDALARTFARWSALNTVAEQRGVGEVAKYVGTPVVARDMLAISSAAGFPKIKYWGVSYGSTLGMTFATLFPDNIERMIVDGVMNATDYYRAEWRSSLDSIDKGLELFASACSTAGSVACAIHESTGPAVLARIQSIFDQLKVKPLPVMTGLGPLEYGLIDYSTLRNFIVRFLSTPFAIPARSVSDILAGLEQGNGTLLWENTLAPLGGVSDMCPADGATVGMVDRSTVDFARTAISCSDGAPVDDSLEELQEWYEENARVSEFADVLSFRILCATWKIRPAQEFNREIGAANTSFPILFVGNTGDPGTPLRNAVYMSERFPGSRVLTINTPGHTSLGTKSRCASMAIQEYFRDGVVPEVDGVCQADVEFFKEDLGIVAN